ncbi:albumin [Echinops telfairi]|uniref:Albumin n=1 Tax=Echinops telfairi TaxID=9371 RepID=A0ABM1VN27_ECHTE|nr:albumin [Echinops telfairi]
MSDVLSVGVNLEAFAQAINAIQALHSSVSKVFGLPKRSHAKQGDPGGPGEGLCYALRGQLAFSQPRPQRGGTAEQFGRDATTGASTWGLTGIANLDVASVSMAVHAFDLCLQGAPEITLSPTQMLLNCNTGLARGSTQATRLWYRTCISRICAPGFLKKELSMKNVVHVSFFLCFILLPTDKSEIAHRYKDLGEEFFKGLLLITFSQYLQKCPYEEHVKLVTEVTDFAKTCVADESAENCGKSLHTLFGDKLCTIASLRDTYGELADCCEKQEPERNECFLKHRDESPALPPIERPSADVLCTAFEDNEERFFGKPQNNGALDELKEHALISSAKQRLRCASIEKFGTRAFKADLAKYTCENQETISSKLKECCEKPVLEKSHCIAEVENDDIPDDLTPLAADFVEDKEVCKNYEEARDIFMGTFLHEYARRHHDYSVSLLLRLAKLYEAKLEKCCPTADPHMCYGKVVGGLHEKQNVALGLMIPLMTKEDSAMLQSEIS